MSTKILILTALEIERAAVEAHLSDTKIVQHPDTGTDYTIGVYGGTQNKFEIVVGRTDQTNVNAAMETERAIEFIKPTHIFYVGVAGGLKDVEVGDVVIGNDVIGYERGKAEEESFKTRPQFGASSYFLERIAITFSKSKEWTDIKRQILDENFDSKISVFSGTIASGEKVDASYKSNLHKMITQNASHALAIEMEGLGFLTVCRTRPLLKSLLLRGISDLVNDKGEMDGQGSQPYASKNVAAFLFGMLNSLNDIDVISNTRNSSPLFEILCKLYPRGIEDQGIWQRASGDLSLVPMNTSGKAQWVEAFRLLKLGGGGNISEESLMQIVKEDFPNSKLLGEI